jgi:hypothetical protein
MPSQVVLLSPSTIHTIANQGWMALGRAFGMRDMEAKSVIGPDGQTSVRIHLDPAVHYPEGSCRFVDDLYALLLTSAQPETRPAVPTRLPDALVASLLQVTQSALEELPNLSGHDRLEISSAFKEARQAAPMPRPLRRRAPANPYEARLRAQAERLQQIVAPALPRLDRKLDSYQAYLRATGLEEAIVRLSLQAEIGSNLRLEPTGRRHRAVLRWCSRRGGLCDLLRATYNGLSAFQHVADKVHEADIHDRSWFTVQTLLDLHTILLADVPGEECSGRLRTREMRIVSPFDGHVSVLELPGEDVAEAMAAFAAGFDAALWRDVHPAIRIAMAHAALVRIHPCSDGNGRLARLLMQALWLEAGLPALPLDAMLCWNRAAYLHCVARAADRSEVLSFLQFMMKIIDAAIPTARHMTQRLKPWAAHIRDRMLDLNCSGRFSIRAGVHAASMLLGPDPMFVRRTLHGVELSWFLEGSGQLDELDATDVGIRLGGYENETLYSASIARELLTAPLARL